MKVKDPDLIKAIKSILKYSEKKTSKEAFDAAFLRAVEDKKAGRTKPHQEVMKKYEKYLVN